MNGPPTAEHFLRAGGARQSGWSEGQKKYSILKAWAEKVREPERGCKKAVCLAALPNSQHRGSPHSLNPPVFRKDFQGS